MQAVRVEGYTPRPFQLEIHKGLSTHRHGVVVAHRRGGKSYSMAWQIVKDIMAVELPSPRAAYIAPFRNQAEEIIWPYLKQFSAPFGGIAKETDLKITIPGANGNRTIQLLGANNNAYERIRGLYFDVLVIDESAQMPPNAWSSVIRPCLADRKGKAVFIGTPRGHDVLYERWNHAMDDPEWFAAIYPWDVTGALDPEEIEKMRADMTEDDWKREMECDFQVSSDDVLIPLKLVNEAAKRDYHMHVYEHAPKCVGFDGARYGKDESVLTIRQGLMVTKQEARRGIETVAQAEWIASVMREEKPAMVNIDEGYNPGLIDILLRWGFEVNAVGFGRTAGKDNLYVNKGAEMWVDCRKWLEAGGCIPDDSVLINQLAQRTYKKDAKDRIQLESKEVMRKDGKGSPDRADSLVLTFAYPVPTNNPEMALIEARLGVQGDYDDYDPFEV